MGCGVSRLDANGLALPARLRPVFLNRLEEMASRRHSRPLKDSTPSKKELLLHENDIPSYDHALKTVPVSRKDSVSHDKKGIHHVKPREDAFDKEVTRVGNKDDPRHEVSKEGNLRGNGKSAAKERVLENVEAKEDVSTNADDEDKEDDNDDDGRRIGHEDDEAFPGSPSFRVYFDHEHDDDSDAGKNYDAFKDTASNDDTASSKDLSVNKEDVKRERKKRSFRKVLPKGGQAAVKNLLNVKSCYTSSHPVPDRTHLLTGKTAT